MMDRYVSGSARLELSEQSSTFWERPLFAFFPERKKIISCFAAFRSYNLDLTRFA